MDASLPPSRGMELRSGAMAQMVSTRPGDTARNEVGWLVFDDLSSA